MRHPTLGLQNATTWYSLSEFTKKWPNFSGTNSTAFSVHATIGWLEFYWPLIIHIQEEISAGNIFQDCFDLHESLRKVQNIKIGPNRVFEKLPTGITKNVLVHASCFACTFKIRCKLLNGSSQHQHKEVLTHRLIYIWCEKRGISQQTKQRNTLLCFTYTNQQDCLS